MSSEGQVLYERSGSVGRILFDRPAAYNALSFPMWRELGRICAEIADDPAIRAVVLRGAGGKAFVSGTDIAGFRDFADGMRGVAYEAEMDGYVAAVERLPQPTVAVIEGWAVGGGLALAFACDFRAATPDARFGSPLARTIGNCLSAAGYARIVRHVGVPMAKRLLLLAEFVDAHELHALGAVNRLAERSELDAVVDELTEKLVSNAPITQRVSKEAIRRLSSSLPNIDDLVAEVYGSADFKEGVRSFLAKEKPGWTGQ
jgi:enoyl-CoA hydratase/carnithine racemase